MKIHSIKIFLLLSAAMSIIGCGGAGAGGAIPVPTPAPAPTKAVVKIAAAGALTSGTLIGGLDVVLGLPAGVSVQAAPDASNASVLVTSTGVVVASGAAAGTGTMVMGTYTAASGSTAGSVAIHVADANGFGTGQFATVTCDLATGVTPTAADFSLSSFGAVDLNGVAIHGLTPQLAVTVQ
jgi:hypothetical protein